MKLMYVTHPNFSQFMYSFAASGDLGLHEFEHPRMKNELWIIRRGKDDKHWESVREATPEDIEHFRKCNLMLDQKEKP